MKHPITNIDKTIQELTNRLDEVHPYSASSSINDHKIKNDGINYWKGKKIISTKDWNDLYQKSSTYTNNYKTILTSRKPLQYFPDDYNSSISVSGIVEDEKLKEEVQNWNSDYYELLEYRKNPTLGRMKCSKCLLSGSNDDPIFVGIEKVFARIVSSRCNNNKNNNPHDKIIYHCNVMNIFSCPFEDKEKGSNSRDERGEESKYPYKREDLFALQRISFAIEQAISTFLEITKNNEIIYEVDFENDKVLEIHTKYNGEPESWGWNNNVKEQLSKVKPISTLIIRDEHDVYSILTNREKLECLLQEYENKDNHRLEEQQVCCDENTPCVPKENGKVINSNEKKMMIVDASNYSNNYIDSHKRKNCHSKNTGQGGELDNKKLISNLKSSVKDKLKEHKKEQQVLLKQNKQNIIDFLLDNKDSIRVEDLKIYEPIYKCYREKGNCIICNSLSNISCINCCNNNHKEVWLCSNHWKQHRIDNH